MCCITLCSSYNSTGQAGRGNNEEFGLLSLEFDENFCMGGPGIIMSRQTLKRGKKITLKVKVAEIYNDCEIFSCSTYSNMSKESLQHARGRWSGTMCAEVCRHSMHMELWGLLITLDVNLDFKCQISSSRCNQFFIITPAEIEHFPVTWRRRKFIAQ